MLETHSIPPIPLIGESSIRSIMADLWGLVRGLGASPFYSY
jgi:hypothetical protein